MTGAKFSDVRIVGQVKSIKGSEVSVSSRLRNGTDVDYLVSVIGPEIFAVPGDIVQALGELSSNGLVLVTRDYGEFLVVSGNTDQSERSDTKNTVSVASKSSFAAGAGGAQKPVKRSLASPSRPLARPVPGGFSAPGSKATSTSGSTETKIADSPSPQAAKVGGMSRFGNGMRRGGMMAAPASQASPSNPPSSSKPGSQSVSGSEGGRLTSGISRRRRTGLSASPEEQYVEDEGVSGVKEGTSSSGRPTERLESKNETVRRPNATADDIDSEVPF